MHTDEYQITLSREITVCRKKIQKAEAFIEKMEKKYCAKSEAVLNDKNLQSAVGKKELRDWTDYYKSLDFWKQQLCEFEAIYKKMSVW